MKNSKFKHQKKIKNMKLTGLIRVQVLHLILERPTGRVLDSVLQVFGKDPAD
jgi:hypothetical protein